MALKDGENSKNKKKCNILTKCIKHTDKYTQTHRMTLKNGGGNNNNIICNAVTKKYKHADK